MQQMKGSCSSVLASFSRNRGARCLLTATALALLAGNAIAEPAASDAVPALTDTELRTAYAEVQAIGGMTYTYYFGAAADEVKLDAILQRLGRAPSESFVERLGIKKRVGYAFTMPVEMRDVVVRTPIGRVSGKFRLQDSWCFVYVSGINFVAVPPLEQLREALPKLVHGGEIPAPADALRPPLLYSYQASQVHDLAALSRLAPQVDSNVTLPNGSSMLLGAIAGSSLDLAKALLDRSADPNKCAAAICPLSLAVYAKNAPEILDLLLARGANPDITDVEAGSLVTPLALAVTQPNGIALAELLLAKKANVDGVPGETPPLIAAAQKGDRATIEMLLQHGADLFRASASPSIPANALTVAQGANTDPKFQEWLAQQWHDTALASGRFDWQGWIEQDGKQTAIADKPIVLKREPFKVTVRLRPQARLMVAASADMALFDDARDAQRKAYTPLHSIAAVVADECEGDERPLIMSGPSTNPKLMGGGDRVMLWEDAPGCRAFTAVAADPSGTRYTRTLGSLEFYDSRTSISDSNLSALFLVIGTQLPIQFPQFDYFGEKRVEIRFR
jgi:Ankyrin repeats (3 copies)